MCHVISKSLSHIFNKSLSLATFPDTLKYAIIKPLFEWLYIQHCKLETNFIVDCI